MVRTQQPRAAGNLERRRFGSVAGQLLSEAAVEGDQFLVRRVLSQKGRDGLLEEALVVWGTVIGGADAVDQRQGRLWPEAWVCGAAGDACIRAVARCHRRRDRDPLLRLVLRVLDDITPRRVFRRPVVP